MRRHLMDLAEFIKEVGGGLAGVVIVVQGWFNWIGQMIDAISARTHIEPDPFADPAEGGL
ncbi:hypothetical protein [Paracoccus aerius]|uniref:Uncharacterized protein n=2 Tax=Paracoccus aerius TaxID=1915382 RepID=A0ABS1S3H0_9RHOB|nr:hypothetical protein [Paracoccus aerius]MBL3673238.1 hypothetical protein [Paracoccus aerius]